jgi:hypothetical protein
LGSIKDVLETVTSVPPLPDLLAAFSAWMSIGGAAVGAVAGKSSTWRRLCENIALGAAVGGVFGCVLVFLAYPLIVIVGV